MTDYRNDPMEQDGEDDAPFAGGSTEQKDAFLGEKLGQTSLRSHAFHEAMRVAAEQLAASAPVVDEIEEGAALETIAQRMFPCATLTIFRGALYAERRHQVGRPLTEGEVSRIAAFAYTRWVRMAELVA